MFLDQPEVVPMLMPRASLHGALKAAALAFRRKPWLS